MPAGSIGNWMLRLLLKVKVFLILELILINNREYLEHDDENINL